MEDEIAEGFFRFVLRFVSMAVRGLVWVAYECCFEIIGWYIGWPVCKVLTLGNLPKENIHDFEQASGVTHFLVSLVGLLSLIGLAIILAPWE